MTNADKPAGVRAFWIDSCGDAADECFDAIVYTKDPLMNVTAHVIERSAFDEVVRENSDLQMVCRRLSAAKTIEARDKIVKQCLHLFGGSILR